MFCLNTTVTAPFLDVNVPCRELAHTACFTVKVHIHTAGLRFCAAYTVPAIIPLTTTHDKSINTLSADCSRVPNVYTSVGVVYGSDACVH